MKVIEAQMDHRGPRCTLWGGLTFERAVIFRGLDRSLVKTTIFVVGEILRIPVNVRY